MGLGAAVGISLTANVLAPELEQLDASAWWLWYLLEFAGGFCLAVLGAGLAVGALLLARKAILAPLVFSALVALIFLGVLLAGSPDWISLPVDFSFVLIAVVSLLGIEWLTRKLLKLA
jgi:hypothetical protein